MKTEKSKFLVTLALILSIFMCTNFSYAEDFENVSYTIPRIGYANVDNLNVRDAPSYSGNKIGLLPINHSIEIINTIDRWHEFIFNGSYGYVACEFISDEPVEYSQPSTPSTARIGYVSVSTLNVREEPSSDSRVIGVLERNTPVEILQTEYGWHKITFNGAYYAYVDSSFISDTPSSTNNSQTNDSSNSQTGGNNNNSQTPATPVNRTGYVNSGDLNVREYPSYNSSVLGLLYRGNAVEILEETNGWYKINFNGGTAYVVSSFISFENNTGNSNNSQTNNGNSNNSQTNGTPVNRTGYVNSGTLNVREYPSYNSGVLGLLYRGNAVEILEENNGWYKITFNGRTAYVASKYISFVNTSGSSNSQTGGNNNNSQTPGTSVNRTGYVNSGTLNVREYPSYNSGVLGLLYRGNAVEILEENNGWYKITFNGRTAYVASSFISFENNTGNSNNSQTNGTPVNRTGYVNVGDLNVREAPRYNAKVISLLYRGNAVEILEENNGWYKITFNGGTAYVASSYISSSPVQSNNSTSNLSSSNISRMKVKYLGTLSSKAPAYNLNGSSVNCYIPSGKIAIFDVQGDYAIIAKSTKLLRIPTRYFNSIVEIDHSGSTTILAAYTTFFSTSEYNRSNNISVGAKAMRATIRPGKKYSFNQIVGKRTPEKGYLKANAYFGKEVIQTYGGGVCQLSSTLYAAIRLNTHFKVTERDKHSMSVSYLPTGMDATVNYGTIDLKFVNNYNFSIHVDTYVNQGMLTIVVSK